MQQLMRQVNRMTVMVVVAAKINNVTHSCIWLPEVKIDKEFGLSNTQQVHVVNALLAFPF